MATDDKAELSALIALLQRRPQKIQWAEIVAEVVASGSAMQLWERLVPAPLLEAPGEAGPLAEAAREAERWSAEGIAFRTILDPSYPARLRGVHDAPPIVFFQGELIPDDRAVSIVGSRTASDKALKMAASTACAMAELGLSVSSGLAAGIDTAAHRGALEAGGRTVAVIPTGINRFYPAANRALQEEIGQRGLVISQFWPDAPPQKHTFLLRNATMSGYGLATVVIEAGEHSGARVQARLGVEHGRPVVLADRVVEQNAWAQAMIGRPGVHVAAGLHDVVTTIERIVQGDTALEGALYPLVSA